MGNKEKSKQLGMNHGTASHRLRKDILFFLLQETGKDICFQCGKEITQVGELSIEHKIPWLHSKDPVGLFFDLDNIAFSHLSCNSAGARNGQKLLGHGHPSTYRNLGCRCRECTDANTLAQRRYRKSKSI